MDGRDYDLTAAVFAGREGRHVSASSPMPSGEQWRRFVGSFVPDEFRASLREQALRFVSSFDAAYPERLKETRDRPLGLFVRGDGASELTLQELGAAPVVGVVGARACSGYGAAVARSLSRDLAAAGCTIVSGLGRGIDAEVHRGALEAEGTTVAVLGCGIDRDYPASHSDLARRVVESGGLIVSEYGPGVEPAPWRFPARSRIIAGLVDVLVVVEARERSGALITVDLAMDESRPVFAVPGEITSALSAGTNDLLRLDGVSVCLGAASVLSALGLEPKVAVRCEWFATCENEAAGTVAHPVLGGVPCCARCAATLDLTFDPTQVGTEVAS